MAAQLRDLGRRKRHTPGGERVGQAHWAGGNICEERRGRGDTQNHLGRKLHWYFSWNWRWFLVVMQLEPRKHFVNVFKMPWWQPKCWKCLVGIENLFPMEGDWGWLLVKMNMYGNEVVGIGESYRGYCVQVCNSFMRGVGCWMLSWGNLSSWEREQNKIISRRFKTPAQITFSIVCYTKWTWV